MSKIFKYNKKMQNYVFLCENMYLPKSPSPSNKNTRRYIRYGILIIGYDNGQ